MSLDLVSTVTAETKTTNSNVTLNRPDRRATDIETLYHANGFCERKSWFFEASKRAIDIVGA
ncbi:MAG: hypothetical protein KDB27_16660, partial [Planctomycetales bacterium]|nr:hypothetical protein [Planctomycetales bacterium]